MIQYSVGTKCFCDFHFGGKPKGVVIAIIEQGNGFITTKGKVAVKLSESSGAYRKGEIIEVATWQAVPVAQEVKREGIFRRVNTLYEYTFAGSGSSNPATAPAVPESRKAS